MSLDLEKCLADLEDLSEDVRTRAVAGLEALGDPAAVIPLERVANADSSIQVRFAAKRSLRAVRETLLRQGPELRLTSDPAVLSTALSSRDAAVRKKCLDACLALRMPTAIPLVPPLLEREQDPGVKRSALLLATRAGRHAIRVLAPFLSDPSEEVRAVAIIGLGIVDDVDIFPHCVRSLSDSSPAVQRAAHRICSRLGKTNFNRLLERMAASSSAWKRAAAARACGRIRQPHLEALLEKLARDADASVQEAAASSLATMRSAAPSPEAPATAGPPAAAGEAAKPQALAAPRVSPAEESVPSAAAEELAGWVHDGGTERMPELRQWFSREKDPRVRASLAAAAGKLGGTQAVELLKECLSDADGRVRANAVEGLRGKVRPEVLLGLLSDEDNRCRANAIVALKDQRRANILRHLKEMASGDTPARRSAIYAIVEIGTPEAMALLSRFDTDLDPDVKQKASEARAELEARLSEMASVRAGGATPEAGAGEGPGGGTAMNQLRTSITSVFASFRRKLGKDS